MVGDFAGSSIDKEQGLGWYETSHSHPDTKDASEKSEIFALGSTFYEILVGKKPYEGSDDIEIEQAFKNGNFPRLETLPALSMVIFKCWSGQYQTAAELLQDIKKEATAKSTLILPNEQHVRSIGRLTGLALTIVLPIAWWIRSSRLLSRP
jgi:serine/threonine protein kinase